MDVLLTKVGDAIFSQVGLAGALLSLAVVWLSRQLSAEQKEHKATQAKLLEVTEKSISASVSEVEALVSLRTTVERLFVARGRD